jgi:hypothetical protein
MKKRLGGLAYVALALLACACGSSSTPAPSGVQPLDPTQPHYGKTYAEWAGAWVQWVYQWPEGAPAGDAGASANEAGAGEGGQSADDAGVSEAGVVADGGAPAAGDGGAAPPCPDPIADPTGTLCGFAQDPASPVFFLAGDWGGVVKRSQCVAPAGKALLIPIFTGAFQDNGGVPVAMQKTDAELTASASTELQSVSQVTFSIDGHVVDLTHYAVVSAPYQYTLPAEPNIFTCQGVPGVTGMYSGYESGYFVLLPPLPSGPHTIAFTAKANMTATSSAFSLDVSYDPLTIQ